ncbi:MAG: ABC transporter ATP-binding protein [Verrucomicrobia bacterium]|nr:ABC transporter ATP-binding protein [Verrucomicrobiota bacterium]
MARQSSIILFDEPITNVDPDSKFRLKQDLKRLTEQLNQTIVYVTHDQNEAMTLADHIVLLKDGEILQQDSPRQIYNRPSRRFGGWFLITRA